MRQPPPAPVISDTFKKIDIPIKQNALHCNTHGKFNQS